MKSGLFRKAARRLTESPLFSSARSLWQQNQKSYTFPLSKFQKVYVGLYLILSDWAQGAFPPSFEREIAWENERKFIDNVPGFNAESWYSGMVRSPFGYPPKEMLYQVGNFLRLAKMMHARGIAPPAKVVEIGCGVGWISELLCLAGYRVTGSSIAPDEITYARKRICSVKAKGVADGMLSFELGAMEQIGLQHQNVDCIVVHEALHHAFDWKETGRSVFRALKPGGWYFICYEPNIAHTLISYRLAKLTNTHEIGLSRRKLKNELYAAGFSRVQILTDPFHFGIRWHWIAAQK